MFQQINFYPEEHPETPDDAEEDVLSLNSQLRKARSVESTCMENQPTPSELTGEIKQHTMSKTKSEYNINDSTLSLHRCKYWVV